MSQTQEKFQALLRRLFQFDCADLDFGIYRIMNYKRDVIEEFIAEKLPKLVGDELETGMLVEQTLPTEKLRDTGTRSREDLSNSLLDDSTNSVYPPPPTTRRSDNTT